MDNIISALSNVLSLEESTPDFLPKEVILKGRTIYGFLTNANLTYKLNPNLGVSLGVQYMYSELLRMRTHYHGERVIVKLDGNNDTNLTRINFTTGLSYYF